MKLIGRNTSSSCALPLHYSGSMALANIGMAGFGVVMIKSHFPTLFAEGFVVAWCAIRVSGNRDSQKYMPETPCVP